jgi:hypothetical protein
LEIHTPQQADTAPGLSFEFVRCPELPQLSWCLEIEDGAHAVRVLHGAAVETGPRGFFEGAWAGDFTRGDFESDFMTGTGAKLVEGVLMLVTPNHTLDRLNVLRKDGVLYVSNSLPFVLARSQEELDADFLFYDSYVASIKQGLKKFERHIPTKSGLSIRFLYCCNALLKDDRALVVLPKVRSPAFATFAEYKAFLDETVLRIARNGADARRHVRYSPMAAVSRGYDSPTALVVALAVGCRQAVTFRHSRGGLTDEDCGTPIAERLGVKVREFGRLDYRQYPDFPEVENSGGPADFLSFGESLRGTLLFTGFHGDKLWDKNCDKISRDIVRGDSSGASLTEYRLRVGYTNLPVPFIGVDSHPELYAIANSREMAPWSVGNLYDRPIARRIVEEAGIPRELFGQKKRAAGVVVTTEGIAGTMSARSLADFNRFAEERWDWLKTANVSALRLVKTIAYVNQAATTVAKRLAYKAGLRLPRVPCVIPRKLDMLAFGYVGKESLLFHWGVEKLIARYQAALTQRPRSNNSERRLRAA